MFHWALCYNIHFISIEVEPLFSLIKKYSKSEVIKSEYKYKNKYNLICKFTKCMQKPQCTMK